MTKKNLGSLAVAAAVFVAACADPATSPSRNLDPGGISAAVLAPDKFFPDWDGLDDGEVQLCKVADAPGTFAFTMNVNGAGAVAIPGGGTIEVTQAGVPVCRVIFTSIKLNEGVDPDQVVIEEGADPSADWDLIGVDVQRYLLSGLTYPAPRLDDATDLGNRRATVYINSDMARSVIFTNDFTAPPPPPGLFGCTPGYWKQSHHFGNWIGYTGGQSYYDVFGVGAEGGLPANLTLLQALQMGGGGIKAMVRHSVASLLNAAQGFAPYTEAQIIAFVQNAFATNDYSTAHSLFEDYNETGCPLGRAPLTKN